MIGPNCIIEDGVRIKRSTVMEGATVKQNSWIDSSIIGWQCSIGKWVRMENISVLGMEVTVADELYINGGTILPQKGVSQTIPEPTIIL